MKTIKNPNNTVIILGSGSATPTPQTSPSSQVVTLSEKSFLIDCGEGTQLTMVRLGVKTARLYSVFISHLHADHCLGLIGLIVSMIKKRRTQPLHIYAQPDLEKIMRPMLDYLCKDKMLFDLIFHAINPRKREVIFDDRTITVETIPLKHRVPTCGFLFLEKKRNQEPIKRYAYCSDTRYNLGMIEQIQGVQTLFHESTFSEKLALRAAKAGHSTAKQAADIALRSGTQKLIIGHFSARIPDHQEFLVEAQEIFPDTVLAVERTTIDI
jgi:ribonuclease Z